MVPGRAWHDLTVFHESVSLFVDEWTEQDRPRLTDGELRLVDATREAGRDGEKVLRKIAKVPMSPTISGVEVDLAEFDL